MFFLDPKLPLGNQDEGEKAKGGKTWAFFCPRFSRRGSRQ